MKKLWKEERNNVSSASVRHQKENNELNLYQMTSGLMLKKNNPVVKLKNANVWGVAEALF